MSNGPKTPASAIVFAIFHFIVAVLSLCGAGQAIASLVSTPKGAEQMPYLQELNSEPLMKAWIILAAVYMLFTIPVLIALGIGLIRLREWARLGSIILACLSIGYMVINNIVQTVGMILPLYSHSQSTNDSKESLVAILALVFMVIISIMSLVYNGLMIFFMRRRILIDAIREAALARGEL